MKDEIKARIRRRKQMDEAKAAVDEMEVNELTVPGQYTHVGTIRLDGKIILYYGKMWRGRFVFDPMTRYVV